MIKLNLPEFEHKISDDKIFDIIRKKYVKLTPEEWVRQNIIRYITDILLYPPYLIGVEKEIKVFNTSKRPDIVVFNKNLKPHIIVECKKPEVKIDKNVFSQAVNYYLSLPSNYFWLTNGLQHITCLIKENNCIAIEKLPSYEK